MPIEVGAVEVGQGKDEQNFKFQNQTSGIPGLQHSDWAPTLCQAPGGRRKKATADPGLACGPRCPHSHHTLIFCWAAIT